MLQKNPPRSLHLVKKASYYSTQKCRRSHTQIHDTEGAGPGPSHSGHSHSKPARKASVETDMGTSAMILHVVRDALGNVGVIASALII